MTNHSKNYFMNQFQQATQVYFSLTRGMLIFFQTEDECKQAYTEINEFFWDKKLVVTFTIKSEEMFLQMVDEEEKHFETKALSYSASNALRYMLNMLKTEKNHADLLFLYGDYNLENLPYVTVLESPEEQLMYRIPDVRFKITS